MVYNKFILLLIILSSEVLSSDTTNETDQKYILQPHNDSSFYVQALETKSEKNHESLKEWVFSPSTVNAILGNILKSNENLTLKKREVGVRDDSSPLQIRKTEDMYYTLYNGTMNESFTIDDYFKHMRQAGSFPEPDSKVSVLSALINSSVKALKERENITVKPMPFFKNFSNSTVQSQTKLYVSSPDNITSLDIEGNTTMTSNKSQDYNEMLSTEISENISGTSPFSTTMTSSDVNIYTPYDMITGFNFNHLNLSSANFTSADSFTSTVSINSTPKQDNAHNYRTKLNTEIGFDDFNTTLAITRDEALFKVYDYETEPSSTSAFVTDFMNDSSTMIVGNLSSAASPSLIRKYDEKEITSAADFLSTGSSASFTFVTDFPLYNNSQSIKDEHNITKNPISSSTVSTSSTSVTDLIINLNYSRPINNGEHTVTENSTSTPVSKLSSYNISVSSQSFTEDKGLQYNSSSGSSSTSIPVMTRTQESTQKSGSPDLSLAEVKFLPIEERANRILLIGIILCCLASLALVSILIMFFYNRRKKSTSNQIEMTYIKSGEV